MHTLFPERAAGVTVRGDAVVEPGRSDLGVDDPTGVGGGVQAAQPGDRGGVAGEQPGRDPGVGFGIVFAQTTIGGRCVDRGLLGRVGGVVVVADAPPCEP
jgi:hypothetical protein